MAAFHSATPVDYEEELKRAAAKVINADFSDIEAKMHRYPAIFRGMMSKDDRYFVPRCVAIGPYHHHAHHHLRRAEEIKRAAAYFFCNDSGHSAEMVYAKILTMADDVKRCYDHDAVSGFSQAEFATMMFQDGCFLLQYIIDRTTTAWQSLSSWFLANQESILRDIFLLENQVPWLVLDALMSFMPVPVPVPMGKFISDVAKSFEARVNFGDTASPFVLDYQRYRPAHLLDLLRYYQSGFSEEPSDGSSRSLTLSREITSLPQSTSAIDLAEIGVHLTNNRTGRFRDMGVGEGIFFYSLFLTPLVMDDFNACWLLNMVAFEMSLATRYEDDTVRSYVLLIVMLMSREEDVHELRVKRILHGQFSDQRTLSFFSDLAGLILLTKEHKRLLADLEAYRRKRWMWLSLHKFIYNNWKYIVTVLSIIGALVGIFKTLFSIEQQKKQ